MNEIIVENLPSLESNMEPVTGNSKIPDQTQPQKAFSKAYKSQISKVKDKKKILKTIREKCQSYL